MARPSATELPPATVREMYETKKEDWNLELIAGESGLDREITTFELNRPGLALAGYYDIFSIKRVQLIGLTETEFLKSLSPPERKRRIHRTFEFPVPCAIITTSLDASPEMIEVMEELKLPLLRTTHITSPFQSELAQYLERRLAPRWIVNGVMMEVFGLGVLIQGRSGVGKSECALELVDRGHLMVADDIVLMRRVSRGRLFGEPSPNLRYHMEIRGIGIIDVERLFGIRSIREESELSLIVNLEKWNPKKEYERLGLTEDYRTLFDCKVPQVVMPVEPGRNIAQLIEIAALSQRLKSQGINVAQDLDRHLMRLMDEKRASTEGRKTSRRGRGRSIRGSLKAGS